MDVSLLKDTRGATYVIKPQTFMNESGKAIQQLVSYYKIQPDRLLVIHDDLDLPFGELRPAFDRGPAGHNGVTDVIEKLSSQKFHRLRIGIGSNREKNLAAEDFVLQNFTAEEEVLLNAPDGALAKATTWVVDWIRSFPSAQ